MRVRSPRVREVVRSLYKGRGAVDGRAKTAIKAVTPQRFRHNAISFVNRAQLAQPQPIDENLMLELRRRFKNEVVALSEYLDRDLVALWGYEDID